eukprot:TRINITY_DN2416_c0_g1_i1.p1 TRINITY_DN2416_c0_g1~~TRINITY_DN2416_c0_g1_i1.p1  ORF type:complete len:105 (-),score=12.79 TRINITY_DN2416_c0_g1_i1:98-412(-)
MTKTQRLISITTVHLYHLQVMYSRVLVNCVKYFKWQFDGRSNKWYDYDVRTSKYIEQQYKLNHNQMFMIRIKNRKYSIDLCTMQQQSQYKSTSRFRRIRRVSVC